MYGNYYLIFLEIKQEVLNIMELFIISQLLTGYVILESNLS